MNVKIKKKIYKARTGATFNDKEAQVIGKYLEGFPKEKSIDNLLEDAKTNEESPYRKHLEWDDAKAGEEYRRQQIRNINNHLSVEIILLSGKVKEMDRALVSISEGKGKVYEFTEEVISDEDRYKTLIRSSWAEFAGWRRRNKQYTEFKETIEASYKNEKRLVKEGFLKA